MSTPYLDDLYWFIFGHSSSPFMSLRSNLGVVFIAICFALFGVLLSTASASLRRRIAKFFTHKYTDKDVLEAIDYHCWKTAWQISNDMQRKHHVMVNQYFVEQRLDWLDDEGFLQVSYEMRARFNSTEFVNTPLFRRRIDFSGQAKNVCPPNLAGRS